MSYRLEEIRLAKPIEIGVHGKPETVQKVIRLTVTGELFQPGVYTIWLGEESFTDVRRSPTELTTVIFDRSTVKDGAVIAVSYETLGDHSRTILPETLYVPLQARLAPLAAPRNRIARIRRIKLEDTPNSQAYIEIELTSDDGFPTRNALRIFQIGEFESYGFGPSANDRSWLIRVPTEVFAGLKDDAFVFEKTERGKNGLRGARNFGRLNKALLEP
jgi:hypothetical protein